LDRAQQSHPRLAFPLATVKKFSDDRAGDLAALVAYYSFFSIFPLLLAAVTVLGFVLDGRPKLRQDLVDSALGQLPVVGDQIGRSGGALQGSGVGLVIGLVGAILAGLGAMTAAQTAMNRIWYVPRADQPTGLQKRARALVALGVVGLGAIGVLVVSNIGSLVSDLGVVSDLAIKLGAFVVSVAVFILAFKVLTSRHLSSRDLAPGAALAAVAWFVLQLVGAWFFRTRVKGASETYGTFALVIGLLSFFYLLAQVTIMCAEVNAVRSLELWPRSFVPGQRTDADRRQVALEVRAQLPEETSIDEVTEVLRASSEPTAPERSSS
jgi:YihY family inner membrane protein